MAHDSRYFFDRETYYSDIIGGDVKPKMIERCVDDAIRFLNSKTGGNLKKFLNALPIVYRAPDSYPIGYPSEYIIKTMATDGKFLYINPDFVIQLMYDSKSSGEEIYAGVAFVFAA